MLKSSNKSETKQSMCIGLFCPWLLLWCHAPFRLFVSCFIGGRFVHASHSNPACMCSGSLLGVSLGFGFSHEAGSAWGKHVHVSWLYSRWAHHVCVYSSGSIVEGGGSVLMLVIRNLLLTLPYVLILLPQAFFFSSFVRPGDLSTTWPFVTFVINFSTIML